MTITINTDHGQQAAPEWAKVPFNSTAAQIVAGFVECEELEKYYFKKYENLAKAYELQTLVNH
jgi:hypothetical protein